MENRILNIVVAGIESNNKWLLIKRRRGDYQEKWALVGGKMEFNETIKNAILREVQEETGLVVQWRGIKAILNERLLNKMSRETEKQFLIILCSTFTKYREVEEKQEGELRWFTKEEIVKNRESIIPSDYYMLKILQREEEKHFNIEIEMVQEDKDLEISVWNEY